MSGIIQALLASYKSIAAAFPLSGVVAYWKMDEASGNYSDSTGTNAGTPTGTSYVAGKISNAASLSGGTSYVSIANYLNAIWDNPYTLSMWVKPTTLDTVNGDVLLWAGNRNQQHIIGSDGKLNLTTYDGTVGQVIGSTVLTNGNWYHLVFQRTSGTAGKVYVNGVDDTGGTATMRNPAGTLAQGFRFGSRQDNVNANFNGIIDEVGVWNRVLSASEITDLYNSGSGNQIPSSSSVLVYAYGGYNGSYQSINDAYDNLANSWASKTAMTAAKRSPGCFTLGSASYAVGGSTGTKVATNYEYSQAGNSWATKTAMTAAKDNATSGALGSDKGYCIAGSDGTNNLSTNYEYSKSGDSWATKTASTQVSRGLGNGTNIGTDKIYQSCGYIAAPSAIHLEYSQSGNSWTTKTSRSEVRHDGCHGTVIGSNFSYYNGGWTGAALSTVNAQYSQSGNAWASKTACPGQRYWVGSTPVDNDKVAIVAGGDGGSTYYNTMYTYSEGSNAWSTRTALGTSRADFQGATI